MVMKEHRVENNPTKTVFKSGQILPSNYYVFTLGTCQEITETLGEIWV